MNQLVRADNHHQQQIKTKKKNTNPQQRHFIHSDTRSQITNKNVPRHYHRTIIPPKSSTFQFQVPPPPPPFTMMRSIIANLSESLHDPHFPTDIRRFPRGHRHRKGSAKKRGKNHTAGTPQKGTHTKQQMQRSHAFQPSKQKKENAVEFPPPHLFRCLRSRGPPLTNRENRITWAWRKQRREARSWA